ncbi:MAG TPA: aldehyde dehydrogenase [Methylocella sp.]
MTRMTVVDDRNQDDMSRKAGCYLYVDTRLWLDNDVVHRADGPAVIFPDGVGRWYIRGKEITRDVKTYFFQHKWRVESGLDTPEKRILFSSHFVK